MSEERARGFQTANKNYSNNLHVMMNANLKSLNFLEVVSVDFMRSTNLNKIGFRRGRMVGGGGMC